MNASRLLCAVIVLLAAGCASRTPAPVIERGTPAPAAQAQPAPAEKPVQPGPAAGSDKGLYTVKKGDTLYSIALEHGRDYKDIVAWNAIDNPNRIQVGQQLRVEPPEGEAPVAVARPVTSPAPVASIARPAGTNTESFKREPRGGKLAWSEEALARLREPPPEQLVDKPAEKPPVLMGDDAVEWAWPAPGKTLAGFIDTGAGANKGIDIAGKPGEPVQAAAAGKVVYAGSGLRGYGNLVIVKHNASYLSAYAHNSKILVKEGQAVARGQKIAEIGNSDADQAKLHFEIRLQGKPVDPLKYLPAR